MYMYIVYIYSVCCFCCTCTCYDLEDENVVIILMWEGMKRLLHVHVDVHVYIAQYVSRNEKKTLSAPCFGTCEAIKCRIISQKEFQMCTKHFHYFITSHILGKK